MYISQVAPHQKIYSFPDWSCAVCLWAPQVDNATTDWDETQAWGEGDLVNATCIGDHHFSTTLSTTQSVECSNGVWKATDSCEEGEAFEADFVFIIEEGSHSAK